jgi:serine/threonine-protein kinase
MLTIATQRRYARLRVIGQVIGNYRIVGELGRGGMGMVYRAEHIQLGRPAALKMLLPALSSDPGIVQRFFNEARAASAIDHPGIVEVYDFGTHTDGSAYIVMALLKGETLSNRLDRGALAPLEGASLMVQVLSALSAAHARGIVHRDLKPDNIFLVPNELMAGGTQAKLLDFGIAKLGDDKAAGVKTQTGMMIGTPAYMSPEQCMGLPDLDHRTDLYSAGCILFHILCGRPPFMSEHGTGMIIAAQMRDAPPDPRSLNPSIPPPLAAIVLRCLEKDPAARYQTATELKNALVTAGAHGTVSRPPMSTPDSYAPTLAPTAPNTSAEAVAPTQASAPGVTPLPSVAGAGTSTTRSSAAAQVVSAPAGKRSSAGRWLAIGGTLLVVGGIAVAVVLTQGGSSADRVDTAETAAPAAPTVAAPTHAATEPPAHASEPPTPEPVTDPEQTRSVATETPCPEGMARSDDTRGNCCWPGQAWSSASERCVGLPSCPDGMKRKGESCIEVVAAKPTTAPSTPTTTTPTTTPSSTAPAQIATSGTLTFKLDRKAYGPGEPITVTFPSAMSSKPNNRAWVTVVEAAKPPTQYGAWEYVADGATSAKLTAPKTPGSYEVRLHTEYPAKSTNVVFAVPLTVADAAAKTPATAYRFHVKGGKDIHAGDKVELVFAQPMDALPGEKFWVTVVKPDADPDSYGTYNYVPAGARKMMFEVPKQPGDYELRLHANYPTKSTNLVHRVKIHVSAD